MLNAVQWARENDFPFLGICLGLQIAIIEFARNVCDLPDPNSTEFAPECETPVIALMQSQRDVSDLGGTMRLGAYTARLRPGSRVAQAYGTTEISERHRHRWEVSNAYRDVLAEYGLRLSGQSPDGGLVETIELPDHAWFIGCQFHPELKSRPTRPHPLFAGLVGAALKRREAASGARRSQADGTSRSLMAWSFGTAPFLIAGPASSSPATCCPASPRLSPDSPSIVGFRSASRRVSTRPIAPDSTRREGPGLEEGLRVLERVRAVSGSADTHRHPRARPGRPRRRGRGRPPDPRLSLPSDRPARRRRTHGKAGQREEGPVGPPRRRWPAPIEKVRSGGSRDLAVTERGTFFGYGDLVVDMRNFTRLRAATGAAGRLRRHALGAAAGSGRRRVERGPREFIPQLLAAAAVAGADGFFLETHPDPDARALSDAATQWPLDQLDELVERTLDLWARARDRALTPGSTR